MAKANLTLPNGAKVTVEGTAEEVSALLERLSTEGSRAGTTAPPRRHKRAATKRPGGDKRQRSGPMEYIRDLKESGFFKTKRTIGEVRDKLEEGAHIYKVSALSMPLYRLVKQRELRRFKEDKVWKYVNP